MHLRLSGLIAAVHTPLLDNGNVNLMVVERQAKYLLSGGVSGAFVCGTTGECHSLTVAERQQLAARWISVASKHMPIVVHVGHNCLANAQALAAHAQQIGAIAIAAMAPSFFRPTTVDELISYCAAIASHAPRLPFYYYDIPSMTGVNLPASEFLDRGLEKIPTLNGVKFTNSDMAELDRCLAVRDQRYNVLFGFDELLLNALQRGVHGAVGGTYNVAPQLYKSIIQSFQDGDLATAQSQQERAVKLVHALAALGVIRAGKAAMKLVGMDMGQVRLPLCNLSADELATLRGQLDELGLIAAPATV